jgi:hypothetical protein
MTARAPAPNRNRRYAASCLPIRRAGKNRCRAFAGRSEAQATASGRYVWRRVPIDKLSNDFKVRALILDPSKLDP